jgi:hypothetical protein
MNSFYNHTSGVPASQTRGTSSGIRAEFDLLQAGFDLTTTALAAKAASTGQVWTGANDFTGATVTVAAPVAPTSPVTKVYADALAFSAVLPLQTGNAGKFVTTDGTSASWADVAMPVVVVSTTTQAATAGSHYVLTNVAASTVTLPASPASGDTVWVTVANSLTTNVIGRNAQTIMGVAEDMTIDNSNATVELRFVNSSWRLV